LIYAHRVITSNLNGRSTPLAIDAYNAVREISNETLFKFNDVVVVDRTQKGMSLSGELGFGRVRLWIKAGIGKVLPYSPTGEIWVALNSLYTTLLGAFDETLSELPISTPPVISGKYAVSLYSDELSSDYLPRQLSIDYAGFKDSNATVGLPDQNQMYPNIWIPMTKRIQEWMFKILCLGAYGKLPESMTQMLLREAKIEWAEFTKHGLCFNNWASWDKPGLADYIQQINLDKGVMGWEPLLLAGNKLEIIGTPQSFSNTYLNLGKGTYKHYPIRVVNSDRLPDPEIFLNDPYICHTPTTIKPTGEKWVFPQFGEKAKYPLIAKGTDKAWIWERFIKLI